MFEQSKPRLRHPRQRTPLRIRGTAGRSSQTRKVPLCDLQGTAGTPDVIPPRAKVGCHEGSAQERLLRIGYFTVARRHRRASDNRAYDVRARGGSGCGKGGGVQKSTSRRNVASIRIMCAVQRQVRVEKCCFGSRRETFRSSRRGGRCCGRAVGIQNLGCRGQRRGRFSRQEPGRGGLPDGIRMTSMCVRIGPRKQQKKHSLELPKARTAPAPIH
jgi:hypothetical protein